MILRKAAFGVQASLGKTQLQIHRHGVTNLDSARVADSAVVIVILRGADMFQAELRHFDSS